jgi:YegS/Rv2252/BmrU family lipid kinase
MWIPVIINPALGQKNLVLDVLSHIFGRAGINCTFKITKAEGDAFHLAKEFARLGPEIIAVYGGDGTIGEVATALAGSNSAMAILPGGTGNVFAYEFHIPRNIKKAAKIITNSYQIKLIDLGQIYDRKYLIRAGVGFESLVIKKTQSNLKDRIGLLAYGLGGLQALTELKQSCYQLNLDGTQVEAVGLFCTVANSGHLGIPRLRLSRVVNVEDGLLDVIVLKKFSLNVIKSHLKKCGPDYLRLSDLLHWQVQRVRIDVDPPQSVQVDGDIVGTTPIEVVCTPHCLKLLVPAQKIQH